MLQRLQFKIILAFAAIYLIWGSTYLAIRFGVETIPPFCMAGLRFIIGGAVLYGLLRVRGAAKPEKSHWRPAMVIGLLMPAGGTGLVTWATTMVPSGLVALLVAMTPLWIVLADWLRRGGARPTAMVGFGLFLGFAGVALLINPTKINGLGEINPFGALLIIFATVFWAVGSVYSRYAHQPRSKLLGAGMQMMAGGGMLLVLSLLTGEFRAFTYASVSVKSWMALGYLIAAGTIAFGAYIWLLSVSTPAKASTYAYVNPVIALALGTMVAGETLSTWTLGCSIVVIVAVMIVITARARIPRQSDKTIPAVPCRPVRHLKA